MKLTLKIQTTLLFTFALCSIQSSNAQNKQRLFEKANYHHGQLEIVVNDGVYKIVPYTNEVIETSFIPNGEVYNSFSYAVVQKPQRVKTQLKETGADITLSTKGISVTIHKSPFQISYAYQGKELISEQIGYEKTATAESIHFNLNAEEAIYGAGARALGMNRRGYKLPLYNKAHYGYEEKSTQMNYGIPLMYSSKMYGIHFDNAAIGALDFDSQHRNVLSYETISGRKTYQVIAGKSWTDLISNYVNLTGHQPIPPRWALGNFASRFGYHSEAEARNVISQFREQKIPVDAIIFDLFWFGKDIKGTMGNLAFDADNFPQPKKMIADFNQQGVKTVLITEPFILTTSKRWNESVAEDILAKNKDGKPYQYDFYFGNTGLIDIFKPKAKEWFWNIYRDLAKQGVAGVWGDLGEPEVHPSDLIHVNGTADQVHNVYGHEWAKLVFDGYKKEFPDQRPFILMRSGYSGTQRFGLIPWSGDVNRSWGGLKSQPEIALQMGMQGLAYMHSDLGGFAGAYLDDELYARWLQYGVFQPIFRPHAQEELASEPIFRSDSAKALAKKAIQLRYQLLPYNYTLAFDNNQLGLPLMRPLFFEEPNNKDALLDASNYLWGSEFLVHPIVNPGQKIAEIRFPAGHVWFDFYSGQKYLGGKVAEVSVSAENIPVFVKAGAFIPMVAQSIDLQTTQNYSDQQLELHYYHDDSVQKSQGKMYHDDGALSQAFEKGAYRLTNWSSRFVDDKKGKELQLLWRETSGKLSTQQGNNNDRQWTLLIHNIQKMPQAVSLNGVRQVMSWDSQAKTLKINFTSHGLKSSDVKIMWN
jgi:oligosaccharide 4-alpha-D-glucosyltransferase